MKKSIIALMGLFTLIACSDESYQEADKMNESGTVENTGSQNSIKTVDPTNSYESPFDISIAGSPLHYTMHNNTNFELSVTPYVGLAYFDGRDDGTYYSTSITTGYPNLYNNNIEYLNLIECPPIVIAPMTSLDESPLYHCPTVNPNAVFFDVVGAGATLAEATLLESYGKAYYYNVDVIDRSTSITVFSGLVRLKFDNPAPVAPWGPLSITSMFNDDVYFHGSSEEIIMANNNTPNELNFTYSGINYYIKMISDLDRTILEVQ